MEWMWVSRCVLHPKQLFFSTDVSFKELFAPENERAGAAALESSWVPTLPQGKSESHPSLEEALSDLQVPVPCRDVQQAGDGIWTETFVSQDLGWHPQFISCWPQNNHHLIKTFVYCQWLVNLWRFAWDRYQFSCQTLSEPSEPLVSKRIGLEISSDKDLLCDWL